MLFVSSFRVKAGSIEAYLKEGCRMSRIVTFEQFDSFMAGLAAVGLRNGDTAELVLRHVGIRPSLYGQPCLAFCPSVAYDLRVLGRNRDHRHLPAPTLLQFEQAFCREISAHAPGRGFLDLSLHVHGNGVIHLGGKIIRAEDVSHEFPVQSRESYRQWLDLTSV